MCVCVCGRVCGWPLRGCGRLRRVLWHGRRGDLMWRPRRPGGALCPLVRSVPCARAIFIHTMVCMGHGTRGVGRDPGPRGSPGPRASCGSEVDVVLRERPPCETSRRPRDGRGGRLRAGRCRASVDVRCVCVHRARAPGGRLLSCSDSMVSKKFKKPCFVTRRRSLTSSQNSARHTGRSYYGYYWIILARRPS